jgi:hypothetical protein
LSPSGAKIKNVWSSISVCLYFFIVCWSGMRTTSKFCLFLVKVAAVKAFYPQVTTLSWGFGGHQGFFMCFDWRNCLSYGR